MIVGNISDCKPLSAVQAPADYVAIYPSFTQASTSAVTMSYSHCSSL